MFCIKKIFLNSTFRQPEFLHLTRTRRTGRLLHHSRDSCHGSQLPGTLKFCNACRWLCTDYRLFKKPKIPPITAWENRKKMRILPVYDQRYITFFGKNSNIKLIHWILGGFLEKLEIIFKKLIIILPVLPKLYGELLKIMPDPVHTKEGDTIAGRTRDNGRF